MDFGKGIDKGFGTPPRPGFGVRGFAGDCTRTAGARRCGLAEVFGRAGLLMGADDAALTGIGGFGRRGGWRAGGSVDGINSVEAGICRGVVCRGAGKGVAGAATVTAGTASVFILGIGEETAFERAGAWSLGGGAFAGGGLETALIGGLTTGAFGTATALGGCGIVAGGGAAGLMGEAIAIFAFAGDDSVEDDGSPAEERRLFLRLYLCFESSAVLEVLSATLLTRAAVNI